MPKPANTTGACETAVPLALETVQPSPGERAGPAPDTVKRLPGPRLNHIRSKDWK